MKLLVVDPRQGKSFSNLFIAEENDAAFKELRLGYAPELFFDEVNKQITVVETELKKDGSAQFWIKGYAADSMELDFQFETPPRPMYSGYPGRSTRIKSSPSGRYLYFQEQTIHPNSIEIYRILIHRYDFQEKKIEKGAFTIDSCLLDFDQFGENEDELAFHLSCEFPSVIAFGKFNSSKLEYLSLENLESRVHTPKETCGSWFSRKNSVLYCITGEGVIYEIRNNPPKSRLVAGLKLEHNSYIPLQQIYECGEFLIVGISKDLDERGCSLASKILTVSIETGEIINKYELPFPIRNFVATPDNQLVVGVSPYQKAIIIFEAATGKVLGGKDKIGITPAEVLIIP